MITLVYGGSGSGKSEYAEGLLLKQSDPDCRYYLATMMAYGEEGRARVARHRKLREGKGFQTVECPLRIETAAARIRHMESACILLECVSNLTANEMFDGEGAEQDLEERILSGILGLCRQVKHAVIVSNNIFEDGMEYDETTVRYALHLSRINTALAAAADRVVEVAAGTALPVRGSLPYETKEKSALPRASREDGMKLVIGGYAQGKLDYVLSDLAGRHMDQYLILEGASMPEHCPEEPCRAVIVNHLHRMVRQVGDQQQVLSRIRRLRTWCTQHGAQLIVLCDELGNGVVPADYEDRQYREMTGRVLCELAECSDSVVRVLCGIGQVIK